MGRRSDHTRDELYAMALEAARNIVEAEGLRRLTVRQIAAQIGYSGGTLYNIFENLDDLIVHLNGSTLDALYEELARKRLDGEPEKAVKALVERYVRFTRKHPKLWYLLFEHQLPDGKERPSWHFEKTQRLRELLEQALAPLFEPEQDAERRHSAMVIWASMHGICSLESAGKLLKTESVEALSNSLVSNYLAGLRSKRS